MTDHIQCHCGAWRKLQFSTVNGRLIDVTPDCRHPARMVNGVEDAQVKPTRTPGILLDHVCVDCGGPMIGKQRNALRCDPCVAERRKVTNNRSATKRVRICVKCEKPITARSTMFCKEHQKEARIQASIRKREQNIINAAAYRKRSAEYLRNWRANQKAKKIA